MPQTVKYGITIHADNTLTIEHYPESESVCDKTDCTSHGYYRVTAHNRRTDETFEAWLCGEHVKILTEVCLIETEFNRDASG